MKKKKEKWEIVLKDRFLTNKEPENPYIVALLYFVVFFLSFLLIFVCFFQLCDISGSSMESTFQSGDHVLLLKVSSSYDHDDIVVITKDKNNGTNEKTNIIKRVIAVEGDVLIFHPYTDEETGAECVEVFRRDKGTNDYVKLEESYIKEPILKNTNYFPDDFPFDSDIEIPDGNVFVMGDNRNHSSDSRSEDGFFYPVESIYGKSVLTIKKDTILEYLLKLLYHDTNPAG